MREHSYEPLTPYPGRNNLPWTSRHVLCGRTVAPPYTNIRAGFGGCKRCGRAEGAARRQMPTADAEALMRAAGLEPLVPYLGAMVPWPSRHVACGREISPTLANIQRGQGGCVACGRATGGLTRRRPQEDAVERMRAAGLEPWESYPGVHAPWRCTHLPCGQAVTTTLGSVLRGSEGCKDCKDCGNVRSGLKRRVAGATVSEQEESASLSRRAASGSIAAEQVARAAGVTPVEPYPGLVRLPWRGRHDACGREVSPTLTMLRAGRHGCQPCAWNHNGAALRHDAQEAAEWMQQAGLEPQVPYPGSVDAPWRCRHLACGREVTPTLASVRSGSSGCRFCGRERAAHLQRTPAEIAHQLAAQAGLEPLEPYPGGAFRPWRVRHAACGAETTVLVSKLQQGQGGCNGCGSLKAGQARRAAKADEAVAVMRQAGLEPFVEYPGALAPWAAVHLACGRTVTPTLSNVRQRITRNVCRYCADRGFGYTKPALVYVITDGIAHKVGVTGLSTMRLRIHRSLGWHVYRTLPFQTGDAALAAERAVLTELRTGRGLQPKYSTEQMPQRGETETVDADEIDLPDLWQLVLDAARALSGEACPLAGTELD